MLHTISIYSVFIPLFIGLTNFKNLGINAKIVLLIVALASVPQSATIIEKKLPIVYYNCYIVADALTCPLMFLKSSNVFKLKKWITILLILNFFIVTTYAIAAGFATRFYYELVAINSACQVILVTIYFYELNFRNEYIILKQERMFWFCIGLLFYAPCTFFVFLFYNKINHYYSNSDLNYLWQIHDVFNTLMYLLFSIGFVLKRNDVLLDDRY